jgi:hypothetical protein
MWIALALGAGVAAVAVAAGWLLDAVLPDPEG